MAFVWLVHNTLTQDERQRVKVLNKPKIMLLITFFYYCIMSYSVSLSSSTLPFFVELSTTQFASLDRHFRSVCQNGQMVPNHKV